MSLNALHLYSVCGMEPQAEFLKKTTSGTIQKCEKKQFLKWPLEAGSKRVNPQWALY